METTKKMLILRGRRKVPMKALMAQQVLQNRGWGMEHHGGRREDRQAPHWEAFLEE